MRLPLPFALVCAAVLPLGSEVTAAVDAGEILLGEMNCAACHGVSAPVAQRLASRQSPILGAAGVRVTPQHLQAFLENPAAAHPGTSMPDMLHGSTPAERAGSAEALTHYLISLQEPDRTQPYAANPKDIEAGRRLYHSIGCVACHAPQEPATPGEPGAAASPELALLQQTSAPLGPLAKKYTVRALAAFLLDPLKTRPSGRMPSLKLADAEARSLAMYLLREQAQAVTISRLPGLRYDFYEREFPELPEFDRLEPQESGIAPEMSLAPAPRRAAFALRFRGLLTVEREGNYTFYVSSDDGSRMYLDDQLVVENGGVHADQEREGQVRLRAGEHALTLIYFNGAGKSALKVEWKPPNGPRQAIPAKSLTHAGAPMLPLGDAPFVVDAAKAQQGSALFASLQCGSCHGQPAGGGRSSGIAVRAKPLQSLTSAQASGCLAEIPPKSAPKYAFTAAQRTSLLTTLQQQAALATPLTPNDAIDHTMTALNCYACHQRDGQGGVESTRRGYFRSAAGVDLGDEGQLPPHLSGVGAKLKPEWMRDVLVKGAAVRPYLATRMPQFGEANVGFLPVAFGQSDAALAGPEVKFPTGEPAHEAAKIGRRLVGVGGLTCIACHTFAGYPSLGVPALDLTTATTRLQPDWFRRYLINPQALRPGTRMPSFWPDGAAVNREVLGGDTEQQIAAIWMYLSAGKQADLPAGLIRARQELVATGEAIIYRNFITGGGARAIGVGYPEKANLAYDAQEMRLAEVWQGSFMDAGRHRNGRGEGFEPPLGVNVFKGPPGPPFARLADASTPWPKETGAVAGYQFRGYRLDDQRRPLFRFTFQGTEIEDFFVAVPGQPDAGFRREVHLVAGEGPAPAALHFRAVIGEGIEERDGVFLVDGKMKLKFTGVKPVVRAAEGGMELIFAIPFTGQNAAFTEEISW